jgi:TolB-like protein
VAEGGESEPGNGATTSGPAEAPDATLRRSSATPATSGAQAGSNFGPVSPGTLIDRRYVLELRLGGGGMGEVYRARDTLMEKHRDRAPHVALKLIHESMRENADARTALQRECSRAQSHSHPNIVHVFTFGCDEKTDTDYLTMELLRGESLERLIREHPSGLESARAAPIIEQLCAGLSYAHAQGIVHSDIKPSNVFVTEAGVLKLLDFGIAAPLRSAEGTDSETHFNPRHFGTVSPRYSALELFLGMEADPRDDVYSATCVIYELLSGQHPHQGLETPRAAELNVQAAPIASLTAAQNEVLLRALSYRRAERIASIAELESGLLQSSSPTHPAQDAPRRRLNRPVIALIVLVAAALASAVADKLWLSKHAATIQAGGSATAVTTAAAIAVSDKSIAVLPFADMSEKKDQEYFADGIAEEVLDRLAKVPGLKVVGRASSFQFKGKSTDPVGIGAALGVAYLLEGSVRKEGGRVRVTAQLVDVTTGSQRWSDHFDSDVVDVLQVQDTIAAELARALQIAVEVDTTSRSSIKSPEALDAYLRGQQAFEPGTEEGYEAAVADFERALSLDPEFAPAAIGLARTHAYIGALGWVPPRIAYERARETALLAQRLDARSPVPHVVMAEIHVEYDLDWNGAERELRQAFALGPRDSYAADIATELAGARGQWGEGRQLGNEAIALDPLNPNTHEMLGFDIYLRSGQLLEAEKTLRRALQIAPAYETGHYYLGESLLLQGHYEAALAEFRKENPDDGGLVGSAMAYFATGRKAESDAQLAEAIRQNETDWPQGIATIYAFRGEKDRAFEWLDRAYEARDHLYYMKGDPLLKNLWGDPRYKAFLRKMNLQE